MTLRVGFLVSHPIQYYAPIFRELSRLCDLTVFFAHRQSAEGQAKAGFGVAFDWDVDLLSGYRSQFLVNVAREPSTDVFAGCDTPGIAAEIAQARFDAFVVPGWGLRTYLQAVKACRRAKVPVLVRGDSQLTGHRSATVRLAKALAFPRLLRRFDGYLYVGHRSREYLRHYGAPDHRLFFSPHCVDNEAFRRASEKARETGAPRENRRLLFAGKLIQRKRPLEVLRAAALMQRQRGKVEVAFAGSGELDQSLRQAAAAAGVRAEFYGFVNQSALPGTYASADVLVLPSDGLETWGLVVNEAMACGVPAVVSDAVGCGPDLVEPGVTGATFPLGDVPLLAKAIEDVLSLNPSVTARHLAERMAIYSPSRAAEGIIEGATSLASQFHSNSMVS